MELRAGTSGYAYDPWQGAFYPEDLPKKARLGYYAERLPSVEINNTFYRLPRASVLEAWAGQVPEGFRFVLKASRRITHFKRLKDAGDETGYLLETAGVLGARLGAILFQLPPNLKADRERLAGFLSLLPEDRRAALEFRHPSWLEDGILDLLRERNVALVRVDADDEEPPELVETADWGYLRLRRTGYSHEALAGWWARLTERSWSEAFVFFKHEDAGAAPRMAEELLEIARRSARRKPARPAAAPARRREQAG